MKNTKVIIASQNPVKIECIQNAFKKVFKAENQTFKGINVSSDVSDQPMNDEETLRGAVNRAQNAKVAEPMADFWVGIEGGIDMQAHEMFAFAWVVILSKDKIGKSKTAIFYLPNKVAELVNRGIELGDADDMVFKRDNSKQKDGAIGILTNGLIDRSQYYEQAAIMALIPFINESLY